MGVKNLWSILSSSGEMISIGSLGEPVMKASTDSNSGVLQSDFAKYELTHATEIQLDTPLNNGLLFVGKAVAIDLSCWVCDSQANANMNSVTKPHLRNLLFRTWSLLSVGVLPIFIVEGTAPDLKQATMKARNATRNGTQASSSQKTNNKATRNRFTGVLKECCEFFKLVGVPFIQAAGEAEATCAALSYHKIVSGVITEDSDVFLYGGDRVLRNFAVQTNKPTAEIYALSKLRSDLQLTRQGLVVLSLLLGCDYLPAGVTGVGVASAVKLVMHWQRNGVCAMERFLSWQRFSADANAPTSKFRKNGDMDDLEAAIRDRTIRTDGYPFRDVIAEFMTPLPLPQATKENIHWKEPSAKGLLSWCIHKLGWEEEYALPKVAQFCGRWLVSHRASVCHATPSIKLSSISSKCTRGGVHCYKVMWDIYLLDSSHQIATIEPKNLLLPNKLSIDYENKIAIPAGKSRKKSDKSKAAPKTTRLKTTKFSSKEVKQLTLNFAKETKDGKVTLHLENNSKEQKKEQKKKQQNLELLGDSDEENRKVVSNPRKIETYFSKARSTSGKTDDEEENDFSDFSLGDETQCDSDGDLSFIVDRFISMNIDRNNRKKELAHKASVKESRDGQPSEGKTFKENIEPDTLVRDQKKDYNEKDLALSTITHIKESCNSQLRNVDKDNKKTLKDSNVADNSTIGTSFSFSNQYSHSLKCNTPNYESCQLETLILGEKTSEVDYERKKVDNISSVDRGLVEEFSAVPTDVPCFNLVDSGWLDGSSLDISVSSPATPNFKEILKSPEKTDTNFSVENLEGNDSKCNKVESLLTDVPDSTFDSNNSLSFSPICKQMSLAERMRAKFGKKKLNPILSNKDN